jgi:uncharacterized OB-fold protein
MICPLRHEDEDYRFGKVRIEGSIVASICPECGIIFVPETSKDKAVEQSGQSGAEIVTGESPSEKQILKWP